MLTKGKSPKMKLQYLNVQLDTQPRVEDFLTLNKSDTIKILDQQHKLEDVQLVGYRLVLQFNDYIASSSVVSHGNTSDTWSELSKPGEMIRRHLVRGNRDVVFFAESDNSGDRIFKVE